MLLYEKKKQETELCIRYDISMYFLNKIILKGKKQ